MNKDLLKITLAVVVAIAGACDQTEEDKAGSRGASQPLTVAFIADQRSGRNARSVLELIKAERADLVLHQGDFDYHDDPDGWDPSV